MLFWRKSRLIKDSGSAGKTGFQLSEGSRVAVIGGGPAGSLFSYFLLDMTDLTGVKISVDIYEPKDFSRSGTAGCNRCGGVISESLVQMFAMDGIFLPQTVVQQGIHTYVLHTDEGATLYTILTILNYEGKYSFTAFITLYEKSTFDAKRRGLREAIFTEFRP